MQKRWFRLFVIVALILLPVGIGWFGQDMILELYRKTRYPESITIAAGSEGGRYYRISEGMKRAIEDRLGVEVVIVETEGSLENLRLLQEEGADFALYQPGTLEILEEQQEIELAPPLGIETEKFAFVANLYEQPTHLIVRSDAGIDVPADLAGKTISVGLPESGNYAMSLVLLEHFGLEDDDSMNTLPLGYSEVRTGFEEGTLDAAFNTVGSPSTILEHLFETGECKLIKIPHAEALTMKHVFLSKFIIPVGLYHSEPPERPPVDIETVALPAQLLTHTGVNAQFIQEVTTIVLDKSFARQNDLHELFEDANHEFARDKPAFPIHAGAESVYGPEFDVHLIESWEAAYSLAVSFLIAAFFGARALKIRRERKKGHKLDVYIRKLLEIEKQQLDLDGDSQANDLAGLQKLLDEVTFLRQGALGEFSVHELNEDRGTDCFIEMCHGLSNKINAKISRQRLDAAVHSLIQATRGGVAGGVEHSATASHVEDSNAEDRPDS